MNIFRVLLQSRSWKAIASSGCTQTNWIPIAVDVIACGHITARPLDRELHEEIVCKAILSVALSTPLFVCLGFLAELSSLITGDYARSVDPSVQWKRRRFLCLHVTAVNECNYQLKLVHLLAPVLRNWHTTLHRVIHCDSLVTKYVARAAICTAIAPLSGFKSKTWQHSTISFLCCDRENNVTSRLNCRCHREFAVFRVYVADHWHHHHKIYIVWDSAAGANADVPDLPVVLLVEEPGARGAFQSFRLQHHKLRWVHCRQRRDAEAPRNRSDYVSGDLGAQRRRLSRRELNTVVHSHQAACVQRVGKHQRDSQSNGRRSEHGIAGWRFLCRRQLLPSELLQHASPAVRDATGRQHDHLQLLLQPQRSRPRADNDHCAVSRANEGDGNLAECMSDINFKKSLPTRRMVRHDS